MGMGLGWIWGLGLVQVRDWGIGKHYGRYGTGASTRYGTGLVWGMDWG